ncbi:peptidoglycan glycosyltransferase FtsW [Treponema brennaborense]|uniref:Probable peptidoglycan glycosyltransferase FtsW n=1 Tax=Treponema brennaborense (strain DSM 12168 / CIP 105900 / DD5/3) TaxID=906968 RepID=F4LJJ1_TREBD|nr:putative peptidoglycan glycosyltransferase FtsW [Treponema brennaborense]AEE16386.1 cell cycle protein [Treponema brennaborense DSM 12168]
MNRFALFAERPVESSRRCDASLIAGIILFWGLGILTLYMCSANYGSRVFDDSLYFVKRQLLLSVPSGIACICCATFSLDVIRKLLPGFVIGTLILCLLPFVPGIGSPRNGASRWIRVPFAGETFQPSELAKIAVILFLANWFDKRSEQSESEPLKMRSAIAGLSVFVLIVLFQDDFSTALFILLIGLLLFYMAGAKLGYLVPFGLLAVFALLLFVFSSPFRVNRLIAFINPEFDTHGYNYQTSAARTAISDGGFWGQGMGSGLDKINRIPEIQTDYIFAGWAEAMGFFGVIGYFALLLFFSWRAYTAAVRCRNTFGALIGFGAASCILVQSLMNCGVVCGALPATGITLPFFSYGGSSLLATFCLSGLSINISRYREEPVESVL